jgi:hypothetical protein
MAKLRLGPVHDDKPITRTIKISTTLDADLRAYVDAYEKEGHGAMSVERLIPAILKRFMRADREFIRCVRLPAQHDDPPYLGLRSDTKPGYIVEIVEQRPKGRQRETRRKRRVGGLKRAADHPGRLEHFAIRSKHSLHL